MLEIILAKIERERMTKKEEEKEREKKEKAKCNTHKKRNNGMIIKKKVKINMKRNEILNWSVLNTTER